MEVIQKDGRLVRGPTEPHLRRILNSKRNSLDFILYKIGDPFTKGVAGSQLGFEKMMPAGGRRDLRIENEHSETASWHFSSVG